MLFLNKGLISDVKIYWSRLSPIVAKFSQNKSEVDPGDAGCQLIQWLKARGIQKLFQFILAAKSRLRLSRLTFQLCGERIFLFRSHQKISMPSNFLQKILLLQSYWDGSVFVLGEIEHCKCNPLLHPLTSALKY